MLTICHVTVPVVSFVSFVSFESFVVVSFVSFEQFTVSSSETLIGFIVKDPSNPKSMKNTDSNTKSSSVYGAQLRDVVFQNNCAGNAPRFSYMVVCGIFARLTALSHESVQLAGPP